MGHVADVKNRLKVIQGDIANDLDPAAIRDERVKNPTLQEVGAVFSETVISKKRKGTQILYHDFLNRLILSKTGRCEGWANQVQRHRTATLWPAQYAHNCKPCHCFAFHPVQLVRTSNAVAPGDQSRCKTCLSIRPSPFGTGGHA